jgi:hypothetical protein
MEQEEQFENESLKEEEQLDNTIQFYSIKEGMISFPYYPIKIEYFRERRNELLKRLTLKATDYC